MSKEQHEAISLIIQVLNLANPNPPEKAAERVEQIRKLLGPPKGTEEEDEEKKRGLLRGRDRKERGGFNRGANAKQ